MSSYSSNLGIHAHKPKYAYVKDILTPLCLALLLRVVGHFPGENVCKISYELKETQFPSQTIDPQ